MSKLDQISNVATDEQQRFDAFKDREARLAAENGESLLDLSKEGKSRKESDFESRQASIEQYKRDAERLRGDIDAKKSSLIARIIDYKKISALRQELRVKESVLGKSEDEQAKRGQLIDYYDRIIADEKKLGGLMDEAYKDNAAFDLQKQQELKEEEVGRDVGNLIKKHNVFFVHDIVDADWKPSANNQAIDTKGLSYENQLDMVLGLDPTISVSTLSPDSQNKTFGRGAWGVLLSGGRVLGGDETDAGSVALGLRSRFIDKKNQSVEAINSAIERPNTGGKIDGRKYNELVLEKPEVAGVYFKYQDYYPELKEESDISLYGKFESNDGTYRIGDGWWEQLQNNMKTGAPIFTIDSRNNVRMVHNINLKEKTFRVTPKYNPEDLVDMPGVYKQHTDIANKRAAITRSIDKMSQVIPEEEMTAYEQNKSQYDGESLYNVY